MFAVMGHAMRAGAVANILPQRGKQVWGSSVKSRTRSLENRGVKVVTINDHDHLATAFTDVEGVPHASAEVVPDSRFPDSVVRIVAMKRTSE